jgi:hypothetical protein
VDQLSEVLDSPEIAALVSELESTRWTGRPGYPIRSMVGMALAKSLYAIPTWTKTVALVREHTGLRAAVVGSHSSGVPSVYACYRFAVKLRTYGDLLAACLDRVTAALHVQHPDMGANVAIDGSDMPAYANGQRFLSKNGPERERLELRGALRVARDQRVQTVRLDPRRRWLALARGAAPLGGAALVVGPGARPLAVLARRRAVLAALDGGRLAQRRDGANANGPCSRRGTGRCHSPCPR